MLTKGDWVCSGWTRKQILSKATSFKGLSIWASDKHNKDRYASLS